jgi:3-isopropylmalate/(R)-2-methylmalate dehydratase small subunit
MTAPFQNFSGVAARFNGTNVNTDAIIPAAWLRTAHADFGRGLFARWRYDDAGNEIPTFVLNREPFRRASILVADENFGCGSSREAAVWALMQFGIRCVLAPSFADIFYENAFRNGLLVGRITREVLATLDAAISANAHDPVFTVSLTAGTIAGPDGDAQHFDVPRSRAQALLRGDDEIAITHTHVADINDFHKCMQQSMPWLHRDPGTGWQPT